MTIRILVADDEPVAVERLELALSCIPEAEVIGAARTGKQALAMIRDLKPDVAILDIDMPGQNGFGVLSALRSGDHIPEVIFVTALENQAIKAFEVRAVDYLLKPVAFERLRDAVRRASERLHARSADQRFAEMQEVLTRLSGASEGTREVHYESALWVKDGDGLSRLPVETVDLFEASGDYVVAHAGEKTHFLKDSIHSLQERLDPTLLLRVHRSRIVNLKSVRNLRRRGQRGMALVLQNGQQVPVGPSYAARLLQAVEAPRWR